MTDFPSSPVTETLAAVENDDWEWLLLRLDRSGRGRFWRDVVIKLREAQSGGGFAQTGQEQHDATYLRGWNEGIECAAETAENLHEKPGWSPHYQNAAGAIAKLIRALSDTSTDRPPQAWLDAKAEIDAGWPDPDPFNRKQVEAVCRAVCKVEGIDPDDDVFGDGCDAQWTRYADAVAGALSDSSPERASK